MAESLLIRKGGGAKFEVSATNALGIRNEQITENVNVGDVLYSTTSFPGETWNLLAQINDLPGTSRQLVNTVIAPNLNANNRLDLYIITAQNNQNFSLRRLDRGTTTITALASLTVGWDNATQNVITFLYNNKIYLAALGINGGNGLTAQLSEYNTANNTWTQRYNNFGSITGVHGNARILFNKKEKSVFFRYQHSTSASQFRFFVRIDLDTFVASNVAESFQLNAERNGYLYNHPFTQEAMLFVDNHGLSRYLGSNFFQPINEFGSATTSKSSASRNVNIQQEPRFFEMNYYKNAYLSLNKQYTTEGPFITKIGDNADGTNSMFHYLNRTWFGTVNNINYTSAIKGFRNRVYLFLRHPDVNIPNSKLSAITEPFNLNLNYSIPTSGITWAAHTPSEYSKYKFVYFDNKIILIVPNTNSQLSLISQSVVTKWSKTNNGEGLTAIALQKGNANQTISVYRIEDDEFLDNRDQ